MTDHKANAQSTPVAESEMDLHCSSEQAHVWLQGLLSMAWVDGEYDPQEKALIEDLIRSEWPEEADKPLEPLSPQALAQRLDPEHAEDFLRTAVMTAVADGVYSEAEDQLLHEFCQALQIEVPELSALRTTLVSKESPAASATEQGEAGAHLPDPLNPIRGWMDSIQVHNPKVAHFLCRMIPSQCPFERDVVVFGKKVMHVPAMCKLNPLYDQVVGLRFRALNYLAEKGEDVTHYVQ